MTRTILIKAAEFDTANEAFQHHYASGEGDAVIAVGRRYMVTTQAEADRLAEAGVEFAYLHLHELADGRETILSVPVN